MEKKLFEGIGTDFLKLATSEENPKNPVLNLDFGEFDTMLDDETREFLTGTIGYFAEGVLMALNLDAHFSEKNSEQRPGFETINSAQEVMKMGIESAFQLLRTLLENSN